MLLLALGFAGVSVPNTAPVSGSDGHDSKHGAIQGSQAAIRPEGRLRKLHLVRPDLIPYPIAYEVYC